MVTIQPIELAHTNFRAELRSNNISRNLPTVDLIGIENLEAIFGKVLTILEIGKGNFVDGFDLGDLLQVWPLLKSFNTIKSSLPNVKAEIDDLTVEETQYLVDLLASGIVKTFKSDDVEDSIEGVEALKEILSGIIELVKVIRDATEDGITIDDLDTVPLLKDIAKDFYLNFNNAMKEAKDLHNDEFAELATVTARVIFLIAKGD